MLSKEAGRSRVRSLHAALLVAKLDLIDLRQKGLWRTHFHQHEMLGGKTRMDTKPNLMLVTPSVNPIHRAQREETNGYRQKHWLLAFGCAYVTCVDARECAWPPPCRPGLLCLALGGDHDEDK